MVGNFPNSAQNLVYIGNNHSNEKKYDQNTPSLYVDPNWRLSNNAQFVQSFLNRYSIDPNSDQTLSIPFNFQNATDLNQIHIEGNARLYEEHPNGLQRSSSVTIQRITQVLENLISGYSLIEGDPTENYIIPFARPYNRAKKQQIFSAYLNLDQPQFNQKLADLQAVIQYTTEFSHPAVTHLQQLSAQHNIELAELFQNLDVQS